VDRGRRVHQVGQLVARPRDHGRLRVRLDVRDAEARAAHLTGQALVLA